MTDCLWMFYIYYRILTTINRRMRSEHTDKGNMVSSLGEEGVSVTRRGFCEVKMGISYLGSQILMTERMIRMTKLITL